MQNACWPMNSLSSFSTSVTLQCFSGRLSLFLKLEYKIALGCSFCGCLATAASHWFQMCFYVLSISKILASTYRISRYVGREFWPENLPEGHPSTYIPLIGLIFVIWQAGSLSGSSEPQRQLLHQRQSYALPSLFCCSSIVIQRFVNVCCVRCFLLAQETEVQKLCPSSPHHLK